MRKRTSSSRTSGQRKDQPHEHDAQSVADCGTSRRRFLRSSAAGLLAGAIAPSILTGAALAGQSGRASAPRRFRAQRILLKGGCVLSLDPKVGDFETADVLIDGSTIAAVQPNLKASAEVIDASKMIVMPGFVDTHRHSWEGV